MASENEIAIQELTTLKNHYENTGNKEKLAKVNEKLDKLTASEKQSVAQPNAAQQEMSALPSVNPVVGAIDAATAAGQAAVAQAMGGYAGIGSHLYQDITTDRTMQEANPLAMQTAEQVASGLTREPYTQQGREYLGLVGKALEKPAQMFEDVSRWSGNVTQDASGLFAGQPGQAVAGTLGYLAPNALGAGLLKFGSNALSSTLEKRLLNKADRDVFNANMQEAVQAGKEFGVSIPTSDTRPKTWAMQSMQALSEKIPIIGRGGFRRMQGQERINAVKGLMDEYDATAAVHATDEVIDDFVKTRQAVLSTEVDRKNSVLKNVDAVTKVNSIKVPVSNTVKAVDDEILKLSENLDNPQYAQIVDDLKTFKQNIQGKSLAAIELERIALGEKYKGMDLANVRSLAQGPIDRLYNPLKQDMGEFIKTHGKPDDFAQWELGNKNLTALMSDLKIQGFKNTLEKADFEPEAISKMLFSQKPSVQKKLYQSLSPDGLESAKKALLHDILKSSEVTGEAGVTHVSPEAFVSNYKKKSVALNQFLTPEDKLRFSGLERLLQVTRRANEARVYTPTGQEAVGLIGGLAAATAFSKTAALATTAAGMVHLFESPFVRDALLKLGRTTKGGIKEAELARDILKTNMANQVTPASSELQKALLLQQTLLQQKGQQLQEQGQ